MKQQAAEKQRKAVALISGGLDSMLAVKVIQEQGIHVEGINFFTGFCVEGHTHAVRKKHKDKQKRNNALWVAEQLGVKLHIIDVVEEYKDVLLNPVHGYGKNVNPCLDCKTFMVKKAVEWIKANDFDFIITGEVVGQRPMSQRRETMPIVAKESGSDDLLVRPLSAQQLPATLPEREGWLDRDKMFDFNGRTRKPQMALAAQYGFKDYAQPAGGCCMLTDENYAVKLQDMWTNRPTREYELDDIIMLKMGRHFRLASHLKVIIGREEGENNFMQGYKNQFVSIFPTSHHGALCLVDGVFKSDEELQQALGLVARYSQGKNASEVILKVRQANGTEEEHTIAPMAADAIKREWVI
ncbi:tRNA (5-methylaminomethyl-2-thiouridylate)-methyltransferase [sulfur-oxidizing endosymbiont of Gigantopelta aegis]|uniref:tRNA (5-methylaminomethyl-2-thiouridylate)-methyltransferase n=1 Tax=sulfur-oxidizing endosymbiont of Gigantopelta aegis TaxID=2794934 RepID=UPI0018DE3B6C|nr:tRNA (5-methylaminomethyl-2-thiouridylate)-methyltransferase [sulfur-oxidizing endosymbiont of Gigantopelta aegis]